MRSSLLFWVCSDRDNEVTASSNSSVCTIIKSSSTHCVKKSWGQLAYNRNMSITISKTDLQTKRKIKNKSYIQQIQWKNNMKIHGYTASAVQLHTSMLLQLSLRLLSSACNMLSLPAKLLLPLISQALTDCTVWESGVSSWYRDCLAEAEGLRVIDFWWMDTWASVDVMEDISHDQLSGRPERDELQEMENY